MLGNFRYIGINLQYADFFVDQVGRDQLVDIGHQQPAEITKHCTLIKLRQRPDQFQQELARFFDSDTKLPEGADSNHHFIFRVLKLQRCAGPPLHVHGVQLVHVPNFRSKRRFAAKGQVH
ncbi:hypothetical protein D3C73_561950 [compost metagenome]